MFPSTSTAEIVPTPCKVKHPSSSLGLVSRVSTGSLALASLSSHMDTHERIQSHHNFRLVRDYFLPVIFYCQFSLFKALRQTFPTIHIINIYMIVLSLKLISCTHFYICKWNCKVRFDIGLSPFSFKVDAMSCKLSPLLTLTYLSDMF